MNSNTLYAYLYLPENNIMLISTSLSSLSTRKSRAKIADAQKWLHQFEVTDQQRFKCAIELLKNSSTPHGICLRLQLNGLQHVLMPVVLQRQLWICGQVSINHPRPPHFQRICAASLH